MTHLKYMVFIMDKASRQHIKLTLMAMAMLLVSGSVWAQSDSPYVIKKTNYNDAGGEHYMAHVKVGEDWVIQDAATFSPDCIWYSGRDFNVMGTHHNYYFIDDQNHYHFLSAPLSAGGQLMLSTSQPEVYLLNNTDQNYYFYDWDQEKGNKPYGGGLARGHQYNGVTNQTDCEACAGGKWDEDDEECWAVYWVECDGSTWQLSTESLYTITTNSGRYRPVTVTSYPMQVSGTGGLADLTDFNMEFSNPTHPLSASITAFNYIPAYNKYEFNEVTVPGDSPTIVSHTYYYPFGANNTVAPTTPISSGNSSQWTYAWSISGAGSQYLSFSNEGAVYVHTSSSPTPTLYYRTANNDGHKTATLTLTVTYEDGSSQTTSCTVTVKTPCQNPQQVSVNLTYEGVIVSWAPTAESYTVSWEKKVGGNWVSAGSASVGNVTTHTIRGLEYNTDYRCSVKADCTSATATPVPFHTNTQPDAVVCGAVFGGGRMANVTGNTEVIIINTDSIGAVYGGNDIAGEVQGANGSTIIIGVDENDAYATTYNNGAASTKVRVFDVYGGGNGYYAYNGSGFVAATSLTTTATVANNASVTFVHGNPVWTNETGGNVTLTLPTIKKTAIIMSSDAVKVDSIFGGAKNAFITNENAEANGTSITVKGGTAFAVYGGNNYGGTQTAGKHYVKVEGTKTNTDIYPNGFGRDFGIAYLFGGGNKVAGLTTNVEITGGMCDTVFGGGNAADVSASNVTMNCVGESNTITNAVSTWSGDDIDEINGSYLWNGTGIYNVRTLFGGNNRANMAGLPILTLTSGCIGTVYGGGNAGNMLAQTSEIVGNPIATDFDPPMVGLEAQPIFYGTHVVMDHANMIVDYLYGGCQMSDVEYSTWVEIKNGHVGTVYGGCNVSGDVGSEPRLDYGVCDTGEKYQLVKGATYVKATGGTIYGDLFAGSNGYYHCNDGVQYIAGHDYSNYNYVGKNIPSHNETHVKVSKDDEAHTSVTVKGNVYAGGNMAYVGFINETDQGYRFRDFVGFCSVRMNGGTVEGSVYGGGNRASVFGSNEVKVSGGSIGYIGDTPTEGALYGGNDRAGQVAQITNRVLPSNYDVASDAQTNLKLIGVKTYVSVTDKPKIGTVYGGGNGAYTDYNSGNYCDPTDKPVQSNTFVDINIDADGGSGTGGYINTVYGGGNGVTVLDRITVFVNVQNVPTGNDAYDQIGTIYGGNNQGDLDILSDLIMLHGQVNTVYGGCNSGAMTGHYSYEGFDNIGSAVHLLNSYRPNGTGPLVVPDAKVTGAVYGGCRMNNVTNNSLVLVEGGNHSTASMFGGCDISGNVVTSQVVLNNGTIGNAFGGGNGNYDYTGTYSGLSKPSSTSSLVTITNGTVDNIYGGGNACGSGSTLVQVNNGTVNTGVYGGSNASGTITGDVEVNIAGGTVGASTSARANVHGGGYGPLTETQGDVTVNIASNGALTGPTINGDIYGGSAFGQVSASNKTTTVNFYKGTINGDVYGGGLGDNDHEAEVSGDVVVNINGGVFNGADGTIGGGRIFGCNNNNGSPMGDVTVNIYATDHGDDAAHNLYPSTPGGGWNVTTLATNASTQTYAIKAVFGGGNLASYKPAEVGEGETPHRTTVHVYNCDNTLEDIFGGGNAADVGIGTSGELGSSITQRNDTYVIIDGGRMHRVIGGGNGEDLLKPAANIFGTANTTVYAGLIDEVYGGANRQGDVDAINLTISNPSGPGSTSTCTDQVYGKVFGCANAADYNSSVTTNILCGVGKIGELYGGSNLADIGRSGSNTAHVTLNIYGGTHAQVFAGSKGDLSSLPGEGHTDKASNIYGNVTLNLFGGIITDAYGGSNFNGNITGTITVNVLDIEDPNCTSEALDLSNVYGASNLADYTPSDGSTTVSPVVNVMHIKQDVGIRENVYGGGNQASVTASPQVNIGYHDATMSSQIPESYPIAEANRRGYVSGNVFGGGNQAGVTGHPVVNMRDKGTVISGIYGGCNTKGTITGDINVNIYGGGLGTSVAPMTEGIFGGGKGGYENESNQGTKTDGNITVTIGDGTDPTIYADIYGGSAFGEVGADSPSATLAKVDLQNGTIHGNIFGGGKGDNTHTATVTGNAEVDIEGGTALDAIYGGCNVKGIVKGNAAISITGGTLGAAAVGDPGDPGYVAEVRVNAYGGGLGENTKVKGNVTVTVDNATGDIYGDVYGGSAKGLVNCNEAGNGANEGSTTAVTLTSGIVHGNLYGGGHGPDDNEDADVYGPITVTVEGGTATTVFGCNNQSGTPKSSVTVNVEGGSLTHVCGGGNVADYIPTTSIVNSPAVNISGGVVTNKVVGGGNAANIGSSTPSAITCNPVVTISGGQACTALTDAGVYGGCNASGTVYGNITVNITNADGNTVIGNLPALQAGTPISIHGGGYGDGTGTTGNVTVNYGTADASSEHNDYPMLYGDLYGGSALGTVNDNVGDDQTTVTVLNGSFKSVTIGNNQYGGNIYGGGLGDADHAASVNGIVHVNIGDLDNDSNPIGKASLRGCNVFGCNNKNGSPQRHVYVDVYQTNHLLSDLVDTQNGDFAIMTVYGGGNRADYAPSANSSLSYALKAHTNIHGCDNTIGTVYGGGRAAAADGVVTYVDGGRFEYIFGGGNGQIEPADIGIGGIELTVCSGHVGYKYLGCDMGGNVLGPMNDNPCLVNPCGTTPLTVDYFFFGANKSTIIGGLNDVIECSASPMTYQNVYAGSRLAVVYGDIYMEVNGGNITNLFGGSQGSVDRPGHVRRYPHLNNPAEMALVPSDAYEDMVTYLTLNPGLQGTGGNIYLTLRGGTIHNVYGAIQLYGNVDGDIIVVVDDARNATCPLVIDTLYGGNEKAIYEPYDGTTRNSPQVYIKNGTINYDVYCGSLGDRNSVIENAGQVNSNPYVIVGSDNVADRATVGRNLYGGGSMADVVGGTKVVLRGNATIGSDVYGGSRQGNVDGSTDVQIAPTASVTPITIPDPPVPIVVTLTYGLNIPNSGDLFVTDSHGDDITSGSSVAQGSVIHIRVVAKSGFSFYGWGVSGGGSLVQPYENSTALIIGTTDVHLTANFVADGATTHTLTLTPSPTGAGSFKVNGRDYTGSVSIPDGFPVTVQAIHAEAYIFDSWTIPGGLSLTNSTTTSTSTIKFDMATDNISLTANFTPTHSLTLEADPEGTCSFRVNGDTYTGPVTITEGKPVSIEAIPVAGYTFSAWTDLGGLTITSGTTTTSTVTFTMGNTDANVRATITAPAPVPEP